MVVNIIAVRLHVEGCDLALDGQGPDIAANWYVHDIVLTDHLLSPRRAYCSSLDLHHISIHAIALHCSSLVRQKQQLCV